jgi:hypothetical protein
VCYAVCLSLYMYLSLMRTADNQIGAQFPGDGNLLFDGVIVGETDNISGLCFFFFSFFACPSVISSLFHAMNGNASRAFDCTRRYAGRPRAHAGPFAPGDLEPCPPYHWYPPLSPPPPILVPSAIFGLVLVLRFVGDLTLHRLPPL